MITNDNEKNIEYIQEGTFEVLKELQASIFNKLSPEDKELFNKGLEVSDEGQAILKRERAVSRISGSISAYGAQLATYGLDRRDEVVDFLKKSPTKYRHLINTVLNDDSFSYTKFAENLDGSTKEQFLNLMTELDTKIQTNVNQIGAKLETLNEELEANDINKQFLLHKTVENGQYNYNIDEISQIVMNHIDSNIQGTINVFLESQKEFARDKHVEFKKHQERDILNVTNKNYQKEISNLIDIMKDIETANNKVQYSIISGKGDSLKLQKDVVNLYDDLRESVENLSFVTRDKFSAQWEVVRSSVAFEEAYNTRQIMNSAEFQNDNTKKVENDGFDL